MDATIVIPTYERHEYLKRQLDYLKRFLKEPTIKLIVVDGSAEAQRENEALCQQYQVEYQRYSPEMFFFERWLRALETVETDIVSILADDDLLHVPGYLQAVQFLKTHPDYSAAHGKYITFQKCGDGSYEYGRCYSHLGSITQERPSKRLKHLFSMYAPVHYAVQRKRCMIDAYRCVIDKLNNAHLQFLELLPAAHLALHGKVHYGDFYYLAREIGQSTEISESSRLIWDELILHPDIQQDYLVFKEFLLGEDKQYGLLPSNIDDAFVSYLACFALDPEETAKAFEKFSGYPVPADLRNRREEFYNVYHAMSSFQPDAELSSIFQTLEPDRQTPASAGGMKSVYTFFSAMMAMAKRCF